MSKLDLFDKPYEYLLQENPYNKLNADSKKRYNNQVNANDLMLFLIGMFEYEKSHSTKNRTRRISSGRLTEAVI